MMEVMAGKKDKKEQGGARAAAAGQDWLTENLEAIVIAIIMALVIRQFCIEAFKIPTSSMEPTLIGREEGGDRILVNKFAYRLEDPGRWDVVVFKYPLNRTKNFIKRLVGLPGEELQLRGGDVYRKEEGSFRILRKPLRVQKDLWQEVYPVEDREWSHGIGRPALGEWRAVADARFEARAGEEEPEYELAPGRDEDEAWAYYTGSVYAHGEKVEMGDVKVSFDVRPSRETGRILGVVAFGAETFDFEVPVGEGECGIRRSGDPAASGPAALEPDAWTRVELVHVDGAARLRIGGEEAASFLYEPDFTREFTTLSAVLKIGARGGPCRLRSLRIHRDLYYFTEVGGVFRENHSLRIPPHCYVMLGDNTVSSKDSRLWVKVRFTLKDGTVVEGDGDSTLSPTDEEKYYRNDDAGQAFLTDIDGKRWKLTPADVEDFHPRKEFAPFVPEENIIGQAFLVFWPLKQLKLIR